MREAIERATQNYNRRNQQMPNQRAAIEAYMALLQEQEQEQDPWADALGGAIGLYKKKKKSILDAENPTKYDINGTAYQMGDGGGGSGFGGLGNGFSSILSMFKGGGI